MGYSLYAPETNHVPIIIIIIIIMEVVVMVVVEAVVVVVVILFNSPEWQCCLESKDKLILQVLIFHCAHDSDLLLGHNVSSKTM